MIKKFFLSFLGSMAAIWLSGLLFLFIIIFAIIAFIGGIGSGLNDIAAAKVEDNSVLVINLEGTINERKATPELSAVIAGQSTQGLNLNQTISCIYRAAHDSRISGIYLKCNGSLGGSASLYEIEEALQFFKSRPSKWVLAYGDNYLQTDYIIASGADEIWLNPIGTVDIHGLSATTIFYTGLLEKLGVKMQIMRVGTFKSAIEPYTLKEMSPASKLQQESYMGSIWDDAKNKIATNRQLKADDIDRIADMITITMPADSMKNMGLVSNIGYRHEAESHIAELTKKSKFSEVNLLSTTQYSTTFNAEDFSYLPEVENGKKTIAVLYATGEIVDNGSEGIVGSQMVEEINNLAEDSSNLAGLILRVNSPGGSAFASEQIWEALEQFKKETGLPFYVSMGDVAASGGYYISCGADVIYAEPSTITGSIGIFGMIPEIQGLLNNHLGITTSTVTTNRNGNFPSITSPMTEEQKHKMQAYIERGYDLFTKRCAAGRHTTQDSIKIIAEGRVWSGSQALANGLVDRMGSLRETIYGMAADHQLTEYNVKFYPIIEPSVIDIMLEMSEMDITDAPIEQTADALLKRIEEFKDSPKIQCRMEDIIIQ